MISALLEKTSNIPPVVDYYGGVARTELTIPNHILLFTRRTPELLGTQQKSFDHHHRFVLIVNLETPGSVGLDRQVVYLAEGQAVLIFPHQFHHYLNLESDRLNWLFITFELTAPNNLSSLKNRRFDLTPETFRLLESLLNISTRKDFRQQGVNNRLALTLALFLQEVVETIQIKPESPRVEPRETQAEIFVERVHQYLLSHIARNFTLTDVAVNLKISESHLRSQFRRHFGVSIGHYIRESRIARACGLIHNSDLNISQVAEECGFESLYSFSRAFKQALGSSPRQYRQYVRQACLAGPRQTSPLPPSFDPKVE